jgi:hypothetical protein
MEQPVFSRNYRHGSDIRESRKFIRNIRHIPVPAFRIGRAHCLYSQGSRKKYHFDTGGYKYYPADTARHFYLQQETFRGNTVTAVL